MKQMKLGLFWKAETKDEREERQQRDAEKFCLAAEARQKAVEEERQRKVREKRLKQNARQQKHRDREREERIANGWVPGQRVSGSLANEDNVAYIITETKACHP